MTQYYCISLALKKSLMSVAGNLGFTGMWCNLMQHPLILVRLRCCQLLLPLCVLLGSLDNWGGQKRPCSNPVSLLHGCIARVEILHSTFIFHGHADVPMCVYTHTGNVNLPLLILDFKTSVLWIVFIYYPPFTYKTIQCIPIYTCGTLSVFLWCC